MAIKKPIPITFGLDSHQSVQSVCAVIHIDDKNTETLELSLMQGGEHIAVLPNSTVTARFVRVKDKILISDNVACEVQENGNLYIPIDNAAAHMLVGEIKIEVNIVDENDVLTMQFPLVIRVNNTILADAEISPESEGTIPELLEDAAQAAKAATQAAKAATEAISTKQDKLTAGENITIEGNVISATGGGVTSYENLSNKPKYNVNYDGTFANRDIIGTIKLLQPFFQDKNGITLKNITNQSLQDYTQYFYGFYSRAVTYNFGTTLSHVFVRCGCFSTTVNFCSNIPSAFSPYLPSNDLFYIIHLFTTHGAYNSQLARMVIFEDNTSHKIRVFAQLIRCELSNPEATITAITDWVELTGGGAQIVSGVVNANGTITFTDSEGNSFTTSGESVIGPQGAPGQDYILTAQDKQDIADIVLAEFTGSIVNGELNTR